MITMNRPTEYPKLPAIQGRIVRMAIEDEAAFNAIVQSHSDKLLAIVTCLTRNRHTAEDIVQETFLKLWEKRTALTPENIGGWLYRVAWNLAHAHLKRESCKSKVYASWTMQQQHTTEAEVQLLRKENTVALHKIYTRLPEKQQAVYRLSKVGGLSRDEIAQQLNISPHTVRNHLAKAVQFVKEQAGAIALFSVFFVFNHFFFARTSTKSLPDHLYSKQQPANGTPTFSLRSDLSGLMSSVLK